MLLTCYTSILDGPKDTLSFACCDCERTGTLCVVLDSQRGLLKLLFFARSDCEHGQHTYYIGQDTCCFRTYGYLLLSQSTRQPVGLICVAVGERYELLSNNGKNKTMCMYNKTFKGGAQLDTGTPVHRA